MFFNLTYILIVVFITWYEVWTVRNKLSFAIKYEGMGYKWLMIREVTGQPFRLGGDNSRELKGRGLDCSRSDLKSNEAQMNFTKTYGREYKSESIDNTNPKFPSDGSFQNSKDGTSKKSFPCSGAILLTKCRPLSTQCWQNYPSI